MYKIRSIIRFFLILTFVTGFAIVSIGLTGIFDKTIAGMTTQSADIKVKKRFIGNVTQIDNNSMTVTIMKKVNDKEVKMTFSIDYSTSFVLGTEKKTIIDIKIGDKVTVVYIRDNDKFVAKNIIIEK
ncbi:MAG: hypothetical protein WA126_06070 [Thermodesulfovibrionales bacterium]